MVAYLIADLDIRDPEGFREYREGASAFIAKHGGEFLALGSEMEVLEGNWQPHRLILLRFPSKQAIRDFFADSEYAALRRVRLRTSTTLAVTMDGIE